MGNFAGRSYGVFSVSLNGILTYRTADLSAQLTWFDRRGKTLVTVGPADYFSELDLSPDEHRLVVNRGSLRGPADIWMIDLERGNLSRLTHRGQDSGAATWSPDARWIVFNSIQNRRSSVFQIDSSGAGKEEELLHESAGDT
jgi:hypothetical protein